MNTGLRRIIRGFAACSLAGTGTGIAVGMTNGWFTGVWAGIAGTMIATAVWLTGANAVHNHHDAHKR